MFVSSCSILIRVIVELCQAKVGMLKYRGLVLSNVEVLTTTKQCWNVIWITHGKKWESRGALTGTRHSHISCQCPVAQPCHLLPGCLCTSSLSHLSPLDSSGPSDGSVGIPRAWASLNSWHPLGALNPLWHCNEKVLMKKVGRFRIESRQSGTNLN